MEDVAFTRALKRRGRVAPAAPAGDHVVSPVAAGRPAAHRPADVVAALPLLARGAAGRAQARATPILDEPPPGSARAIVRTCSRTTARRSRRTALEARSDGRSRVQRLARLLPFLRATDGGANGNRSNRNDQWYGNRRDGVRRGDRARPMLAGLLVGSAAGIVLSTARAWRPRMRRLPRLTHVGRPAPLAGAAK